VSVARGSGGTLAFGQSRPLLVAQPYNWSLLLAAVAFVIRLPRRSSYPSISTHLSGLLDSDVQDFDTTQAQLSTIAPWSH
jgi:hypothetical protein